METRMGRATEGNRNLAIEMASSTPAPCGRDRLHVPQFHNSQSGFQIQNSTETRGTQQDATFWNLITKSPVTRKFFNKKISEIENLSTLSWLFSSSSTINLNHFSIFLWRDPHINWIGENLWKLWQIRNWSKSKNQRRGCMLADKLATNCLDTSGCLMTAHVQTWAQYFCSRENPVRYNIIY